MSDTIHESDTTSNHTIPQSSAVEVESVPGGVVSTAPTPKEDESAMQAVESTASTAPVHLDQLPSLTLDEDQRQRLERAKEYIRAIQKTLADKLPKKVVPVIPVFNGALNPNPALISLPSGVDARTMSIISRIYVGSIHFELTEEHIRAVFSQFGYIRDVSLQLDPVSGRHKGFCFIEFDVPEAAHMAQTSMNGAELGGRTLRCGRPNNFEQSLIDNLPSAPKNRIYVSNVNSHIDEDMLKTIFEAFGKIEHCILVPNMTTRQHKTYGFIDFESDEVVPVAIAAMNGFELGGNNLHVITAMIPGTLIEGMKVLKGLAPLQAPSATIASTATTSTMNKGQSMTIPPVEPLNSVLGEENISIKGSQRYAVMQKLAQSEEAARVAHDRAQKSDHTTTTVVRIANAVTAGEADDALKEEFEEECRRFGAVTRIHIEVDDDPAGAAYIFVQFDDVSGAQQAVKMLHGRWFGGRQLAADFYNQDAFIQGNYRLAM
ncbi:hypothetical protein BDF22DRAFT_641921 [Syncephalis plumigaleata]|nr:hypothetical protein BDF22DRAFT_641921 [Syncephalis plumigaleata]